MDQLLMVLLVVGIAIFVFILIREIVMWYYKINERITIMKETNVILRQILMKLPDEPLKSEHMETQP